MSLVDGKILNIFRCAYNTEAWVSRDCVKLKKVEVIKLQVTCVMQTLKFMFQNIWMNSFFWSRAQFNESIRNFYVPEGVLRNNWEGKRPCKLKRCQSTLLEGETQESSTIRSFFINAWLMYEKTPESGRTFIRLRNCKSQQRTICFNTLSMAFLKKVFVQSLVNGKFIDPIRSRL